VGGVEEERESACWERGKKKKGAKRKEMMGKKKER